MKKTKSQRVGFAFLPKIKYFGKFKKERNRVGYFLISKTVKDIAWFQRL